MASDKEGKQGGTFIASCQFAPALEWSRQHGPLTVRQETRSGGTYWYAYRRVGEKMAKRYLGRTTELSPARLEQVAAQLAEVALSLAQGTLARGGSGG